MCLYEIINSTWSLLSLSQCKLKSNKNIGTVVTLTESLPATGRPVDRGRGEKGSEDIAPRPNPHIQILTVVRLDLLRPSFRELYETVDKGFLSVSCTLLFVLITLSVSSSPSACAAWERVTR